jgi:hypothetical protein
MKKTMKKIGRPAKLKLTQEEQEDEVIRKYIDGEPMTLEEASLALWMADGRKTKRPMTKMGFLKFERRVMDKLRAAIECMGIEKEDLFEMFNHSRSSSMPGKYSDDIDEN